jgi:hypothetical protein
MSAKTVSSRVRVEGDEQFVAIVDGVERFRTNERGHGVWEYARSGAWYADSGEPAMEWKQRTGTAQCQGRAAFRRWVVELLEREAD